ncbi:hypothetical protein D3C80_1802210 [compost metagenome]
MLYFNAVVTWHRFGRGGHFKLSVFAGDGVVKELRLGQILAQVIEFFQRAFQRAVGGQLGVIAGLLGSIRCQTLLFRLAQLVQQAVEVQP